MSKKVLENAISLFNIDDPQLNGLAKRICLPNGTPDRDNANLNLWNRVFTLPTKSEATYIRVKKRPYVLTRMERHVKTVEVVIALNKGVIVPLAPTGDLKEVENQIKAFYLPAGQGLIINEGVWHLAPFPLEETAEVLVLFADGTGANDLEFQETTTQPCITI